MKLNSFSFLISCLIIGLVGTIGTGFASPKGDAKNGQKLYGVCTACHGAQGAGNPAMNSPAIAGQEDWYLSTQLNNFKKGIRGAHKDDKWGKTMRPMSMTLANDQAIADVIAYIQTFPEPKKEDLGAWGGDPKKGQQLYATCAACHGAKGKGNPALHSPRLTALPSWYMMTQLNNFKKGIRGAHKDDKWGKTMRPMSMTLANDQAIKDVIAYIKSL